MTVGNNSAQFKLTEFRESRSLICQTRTVSATRTKHIQSGTLFSMVLEKLPVKYPIKQAKREYLLKVVSIWQLGITLSFLVNPVLKAHFDIEFGRMAR